MLSRLVILGAMRAVAEGMEAAGVDHGSVQSWTNAVTDVILTRAETVQETRLLEDRLAAEVRIAFKMIGMRSDEQA